LEIDSLFSHPRRWWFRTGICFIFISYSEEHWADESIGTYISYFFIYVTKLHAELQAQGDRPAKKVNYFSFSYPYVYFKCSSLSVPEGGQLILRTFVSTKRMIVVCLTVLYKGTKSSVLTKNTKKRRKPFCFQKLFWGAI